MSQPIEFADFVEALRAKAGQEVYVEVGLADEEDYGAYVELRGRLGDIRWGQEFVEEGGGIGWVSVGPEPSEGRGTGFWLDPRRFQRGEAGHGVVRAEFDGLRIGVV